MAWLRYMIRGCSGRCIGWRWTIHSMKFATRKNAGAISQSTGRARRASSAPAAGDDAGQRHRERDVSARGVPGLQMLRAHEPGRRGRRDRVVLSLCGMGGGGLRHDSVWAPISIIGQSAACN